MPDEEAYQENVVQPFLKEQADRKYEEMQSYIEDAKPDPVPLSEEELLEPH